MKSIIIALLLLTYVVAPPPLLADNDLDNTQEHSPDKTPKITNEQNRIENDEAKPNNAREEKQTSDEVDDDLSALFDKNVQIHDDRKKKEDDDEALHSVSTLAELLASHDNVIIMCGAGISTSAGIPDFRSPGTGLYSNLQKYKLPYPEAIFELDYFRNNPHPFYTLAKELYPGCFTPTPSHRFIKLLEGKNKLLRCYTQNIDTLEREAGVSNDKLVEAHGSFFSAHCINRGCLAEYSQEEIKETILKGKIPKCAKCDALVKPDIVFFGESLPPRFGELLSEDFEKCDLLIVMGTSLKVHPFASLITKPGKEVKRVLINGEMCGTEMQGGFVFPSKRDKFLKGSCDDAIHKLVKLLGWEKEFKQLQESTK